MRHVILAALIFACSAFADNVFFHHHWTLWKDAEVLIWSADKNPAIDPKEFCLSLKRNNTGIGEPKCRLAGEWERDSIAMRYANWLVANMDGNVKAEHLRARHPAMVAKIQSVEDRLVLFIGEREGSIFAATFDENNVEPVAAGVFTGTKDKIALGDKIASAFFDGSAKRRLSKEERAKRLTEPDESYKEIPGFQGWASVAIGYSQAKIPLTPNNWYSSHINSRVRGYRITKDSVSLWNFIDDSDPQIAVYLGGTWYGFIGAELMYRYAYHEVKIDPQDTIYRELSYWGFHQHEVGLNVILSKTYTPIKWFKATPFAFMGFQYSFFVEDIGLKDKHKKPSKAYDVRIKFEDSYKGALVGFGSHFVFLNHYGLGLRAGISSRGRNIEEDPSPEAAAEPTTIGSSTIDCFVNLGLEYHFSM
ncbi:MAG: hypothetical protein J6W22_11700 [Fibrobacter sp.]|nr:hypothetical protein [Fibrobacter sp.]